MLHKLVAHVNASQLMSGEELANGYAFVTTLLSSIYAIMAACVVVMLLRIMYVAVLRRLHQPTPAATAATATPSCNQV